MAPQLTKATGLRPGKDKVKENRQWVVEFSNFDKAWELSKGAGIVIAHPDTGWTRHPENWETETDSGRYLVPHSRNYFDDDSAVLYSRAEALSSAKTSEDTFGIGEDRLQVFPLFLYPSHGTTTASVLMSTAGHPNASGQSFKNYGVSSDVFINGVAPEAKVLPLRVSRSVAMWDTDDASLAKAICHAIALNKESNFAEGDIGVISISLGSIRHPAKSLKSALEAARKADIVVVASAGQLIKCVSSWFAPIFPGRDPNTICVAACDSEHKPLQEGFYGEQVDVTAPGVDVWRAQSDRESGKTKFSVQQNDGTSYAAPIVAGACALWQSHWGRKMLISKYGSGNLLAAFRKVLRDSCNTKLENGKVRLTVKSGSSGTRQIVWNVNKRGAGVLDTENLLNLKLPSKKAVVDSAKPK